MDDSSHGPAVADMTTITDPVEAMEVLRSGDIAAELHNRDSAPLLAGSVLTLTGTTHMDRRRIELRLMVREALAHYEETVFGPAIRRRLDALAAAPRPADGLVRDDLLVFTRMILVELTARMIGLDGVDGQTEVEALYQCAERFGEAASVEWSLLDHDAIVKAGLEASDEFVERWFASSLSRRRALVDRRNGRVSTEPLPVDLLTMLLVHAPQLSTDEIRREAIFFLLASSSTTTHATPHVVLEILDWIARHPEDEALLGDVTFVKQAVNEGLRLHPPVPALLKRALKDTHLSTGRLISQGEYVAVNLDAVNRVPAIFGDEPNAFNPRRASVLSSQPYGFSFGAGPHMCLGRPLATSTNKASADDGTVGALVRLVVGLMGAGLRVDPAAGRPAMREDTVARRFASFPVVFTHL